MVRHSVVVVSSSSSSYNPYNHLDLAARKRSARRSLFGKPGRQQTEWLQNQVQAIRETKTAAWGFDFTLQTGASTEDYVWSAVETNSVPAFYRERVETSPASTVKSFATDVIDDEENVENLASVSALSPAPPPSQSRQMATPRKGKTVGAKRKLTIAADKDEGREPKITDFVRVKRSRRSSSDESVDLEWKKVRASPVEERVAALVRY